MKLFHLKTSEGHSIKNLAELLYHNFKTAGFVLSPDSISLRITDDPEHGTILFDVVLDKSKFNIFNYKFDSPTEIIGINLQHFHEMFKIVKKRDILELYIDSETPHNLNIKITPKDNNKITESVIMIQAYQSTDICLPSEDYDYPDGIIVPSSDFQKMCRGLSRIHKVVNIKSDGHTITFASNADNVMTSKTTFGEVNNDSLTIDYNEDYEMEQINKISKISGFGKNIQISISKNLLPILFKADISFIGKIQIFIKSKQFIVDYN